MTRLSRTSPVVSQRRTRRAGSRPSARRDRLTRCVCAALVVVMLAAQTPAAPLMLAADASRWRSGLAFWWESSGWAGAARGFVSGQARPASRRQRTQSERDARVRRVVISPGDVTVNTDEPVRFVALAYDQSGNTVGGVGYVWSAHDEGRKRDARISPTGEFVALTPGVYRVTAAGGGRTGQVKVTVTDGGARPARRGARPPDAPSPSDRKGVSTRDLPAPAQGNAATSPGVKPKRGASRNGRVAIVKTAFGGGRAAAAEPPAAVQVWGDTYGWNSGNYMTADDPGSQVGDPPGSPADGGAGNGNFQIGAPILALPGRGIDLALSLVYNAHLWHKNGGSITYDIDKGWPAPGWSLGFGKMIDVGDGATLLIDPDGTRHGYSGTINYPQNPVSWFNGNTADGSFIDYWGSRSNYVLRIGAAQLPDGTNIDYGAPGGGAIYPTKITDANGNLITITYRNNSGPRIQSVTDTLGRAVIFHYDDNELLTAVTAPGLQGGDDRTLVRLLYEQKAVNATFPGLTTKVRDFSPWMLNAVVYPGTGTGYWFGETDSYLSGYGMIAKVVEQRGMSFSGPAPQAPWLGPTGQGTVAPGDMSKQAVYAWDTSGAEAPTYASTSASWDGMDTGPAVTEYNFSQNTTPRTVTVKFPNQTKSVQYSYNAPGQFYDGLVFKDETYDADGTTLLNRSEVTWEQGDYLSARPTRMSVTMVLAGGSELTTGTEFSYQPSPSFNQVTEVRNYGYGYVAGGSSNTLLRKTVTQYENSPNYILPSNYRHHFNLPKVIEVYAGDGVTRVARTEYTYDGQPLVDAPGAVQHDNTYDPYEPPTEVCADWDDPNDPDCTNFGCSGFPCDGHCGTIYECRYFPNYYEPKTAYRGNVTQVKSYADAGSYNPSNAVVETRTYDITGNVRTESTSCCAQTSFEYTQATQYGYQTSQTRGSSDPNNTAARLTTSATYDFETGLALSATDANGRAVSSTYSAATLRPQQVLLSTGAYIETLYDDAAMTVTETTYLAPSEGGGVTGKTVKHLNGMGQARVTEMLSAPNVWDKVETVYDVMGRVHKQSRPYRAGDTKHWGENVFDGLGRVRKVIASDGSATEFFFNEAPTSRPDSASSLPGETTRVKDPWGRERWGRMDALGRIVEVVEPKPAGSGSVFEAGSLKTSYGYDVQGRLTAVSQGAQTRSFRHDTLGRLTHQKLAEQSATLNDAGAYVGAGGAWSSVFAYDTRSNMIWGVDARGVKVVFDYGGDPLNRLQSVSYVVGAQHDTSSPIATADTTFYEYKPSGDVMGLWKVTTQNPVTAVYTTQEWLNYDSEGRLDERTMTVLGRGFQMTNTYAYDTLGRLKDVTYPAQTAPGVLNPARKTVHHSYDVASRLSGLKVGAADYASGIVYNAASQVTSVKVGAAGDNQVTEQYDYDPVTGLLAEQRAYRLTDTEPNRLLHLSYDYLRAGTSAGRTGQLTKITNHRKAQRGRTYNYDALGRLKVAAGGDPNSTPAWTQTYTYDRYGNRETVTSAGQTAGLEKPREPRPAAPTVEVARNLSPPAADYLRGEEKRRGVSDASSHGALPNPGPLDPLAAPYVGSPSNLNATAASASQVTLSWTAAGGAANHRVERANSLTGPYVLAGTTAAASFADTGVTPGAAHLYRVCTADFGGNCVSPYSNLALGTAVTFAEAPLANTTIVRAQHFEELRQAVNAVRAAANLPAVSWTPDPTLTSQVTAIRAAHVQQLRDGLGEALAALGVSMPAFTDPTLTTGVNGTPVRKVHVEELRTRASRGVSTLSGDQPGGTVPTDGHETLSYDAVTNRVNTAGWQYDAAGNQTRVQVAPNAWQRMEYDAANRLVSVKTDAGAVLAAYAYASTRARLMAQEGATRVYYATVGGAVVSEFTETDGTATATSPQWSKNYIYASGRLLATQQPNGAGEYVEYHHPDRLGARVISNATDAGYYEQVSLPYGVALSGESTGASTRRFTTYDRSASTGLDYAVNRHYDSLQGRFTQVDPIGMEAVDLQHPQTFNLYAYCGNDPVNFTDPTGLFWGKLFKWIGRILKWIAIAAFVATVVLFVFQVPLTGTLLGKVLGFIAGLPTRIGAFISRVGKTVAGVFSFAAEGEISVRVATRIGYGVLLGGSVAAGAVSRHLREEKKSCNGTMFTAALTALSQRRSDKIPSDLEHEYECRMFDTCQEMGEKIRDLTVGIAIRHGQLEPESPEFGGHAKIWARQKDILNKCIQKFKDNNCGDGDLPPGFPMRDAVAEAGRPAPAVKSVGDFTRRGGLILPILVVCTLSLGLCLPAATKVPGRAPVPVPAVP